MDVFVCFIMTTSVVLGYAEGENSCPLWDQIMQEAILTNTHTHTVSLKDEKKKSRGK